MMQKGRQKVVELFLDAKRLPKRQQKVIQSGTTLPECMTLTEILPTTIFSVKLMHLCISICQGQAMEDIDVSLRMIPAP